MVDRRGVGEPYTVQLVSFDGTAGPSVQPLSRSEKLYYFPPSPCAAMCGAAETAAYNLPETSISLTQVYFLDGESQIKSLAPDGTVTSVMNVAAPPNTQVVFAVSPDDRRIAVATITLATSQVAASFKDVIYVEDLRTGTNRADIFSSTTVAEWPVAWHKGDLVVGIGPSDIGSYENPYGAIGYHVVDPATGRRFAALDCWQGLLSPAGTACASGWCATASTCGGGTLGQQGWDGSKTSFHIAPGPAPRILMAFANPAELSPDGSAIAAGVVADPQAGSLQTVVFRDGSSSVASQRGGPLGWLDNTHVVVLSPPYVLIVDLSSGTSYAMLGLSKVPIADTPQLAGVMPTNLG